VAPKEYDAAVRETPELCPLLLDGDRRSGSQVDPAAGVVHLRARAAGPSGLLGLPGWAIMI
jgi:hypothetical protein